jgi:CCR4-NOT transcription complex subunit 7/8
MGTFTTKADYHYQTLRCNVDLLKIIQLGITLFSADGELPPPHFPEPSPSAGSANYPNNLMPCPCTWQFNFRFSLESDMYAQASIELLQKSGLDFQMHEKNGIDPLEFGSYLITSGLVLTEDVRWISFHSGYDFGYLMKIMLCKPLPDDEREFRKLMDIFFPSIYDIKFLMKHASRSQAVNNSPLSPQAAQVIANLGQQSGLQDIADELNVKRVGSQHQAGSDSLVTGKIFWEVRRVVFGGHIDEDKYLGQIWGLNGIGLPAPAAATAAVAAAAQQAQQQQQQQSQQTAGNGAANMYPLGANATTPSTDHAALVGTPGPHGQNRGAAGMGPMTPGGVGAVFNGFQFGRG